MAGCFNGRSLERTTDVGDHFTPRKNPGLAESMPMRKMIPFD